VNHIEVVKRAFSITWHYRLLWVFGVVLAFTSGGGGGGVGGGNSQSMPSSVPPRMDLVPDLETLPDLPIPTASLISLLVMIGVLFVLGLLLFAVISIVAKYVSLTAVIRLVDDHEQTGEKRTLGQGLRLGWSPITWRLFLVQLVISLPVVILTLAMVLSALAPLLLWVTGDMRLGLTGTAATVCLLLPAALILIVLSIAANLLARFSERSCVMSEMGVIASVKHGYGTIRAHLKDVGIMWLLMIGAGLLWAVVSLLAFGLLAVVGISLGALPALAVGFGASLVTEGAIPWLLGGLVGLPICVLVVIIPSMLLQGWYQVFQANVWTLTYRELRA